MPIRFTRYKGTVPEGTYAPDLDDRGFAKHSLPYGTYAGGHYPIIGVCMGDIAFVNLIRENIDEKARLYVATRSEDFLKILEPSDGLLKSGQEIPIKFKALDKPGVGRIDIHFENKDGPLIGSLEVLISSLLTANCATHITTVKVVNKSKVLEKKSERNDEEIKKMMKIVNEIFRPIGVEFVIHSFPTQIVIQESEIIKNFLKIDHTLLDGRVILFGEQNEPYLKKLREKNIDRMINIFFVNALQYAEKKNDEYVGGEEPSAVSDCKRTIIFPDYKSIKLELQAATLAHELGHCLKLANVDSNRAHSDDSPINENDYERRHDIWSRRRLMYYTAYLDPDVRIGRNGKYKIGTYEKKRGDKLVYRYDGTDVGYGPNVMGRMITIKDLPNDETDGEYARARKALRELFRLY